MRKTRAIADSMHEQTQMKRGRERKSKGATRAGRDACISKRQAPVTRHTPFADPIPRVHNLPHHPLASLTLTTRSSSASRSNHRRAGTDCSRDTPITSNYDRTKDAAGSATLEHAGTTRRASVRCAAFTFTNNHTRAEAGALHLSTTRQPPCE